MPKVVFPLDSNKKFTDQAIVGHNRWHGDIPAQVQVKPGDSFRVDCREWFDGAIHNDDSADDVLNAPLPSVHVLSGPARSHDRLMKWNAREQALIDTNPARVPPLALPPLADSAILGSLTGADFDRVAREAARTAPPRENGGNQDIKNFTKGTRVFYPVFVDGGNLSMGDLHFSQGDGEITFCGAIE